MTTKRVTFLVMTLICFNPVYYAYVSYYYTDTVSLGVMMTAIAIALKGEEQTGKKRILLYVLSGLFLGAAIKIRVTCIFVVLAALAVAIFREKHSFLKRTAVLVGGGTRISDHLDRSITVSLPGRYNG